MESRLMPLRDTLFAFVYKLPFRFTSCSPFISSSFFALQLLNLDSSWSLGVGEIIKIRSLRLAMDRHRCRLCFRRFSNGRALGGHMRSHVANASTAAAAGKRRPRPSSLSGSLSSFLEAATYEHPRLRSFRAVDPEFSSSVAGAESDGGGAGSSYIEESEAESSSFQRRLVRPRPTEGLCGEGELLSSVSNGAREENVALCLILLSRDTWSKSEMELRQSLDKEEKEDVDDELPRLATGKSCTKRTKYQCVTCRKFFKSYQALSSHRANHKKEGTECTPTTIGIRIDGCCPRPTTIAKLYQCPYCSRTFISGQALGGHKRSHLATATTTSPAPLSVKGDDFIDLNQPALFEEEIEHSALSVATELATK